MNVITNNKQEFIIAQMLKFNNKYYYLNLYFMLKLKMHCFCMQMYGEIYHLQKIK